MSITPELRASARATYRLLFRTAESTFRGDNEVLNGFREKVRSEFRAGRSITEAEAYQARIQLGKEVAEVLRKNVVQGVKVDAPSSSSAREGLGPASGVWRLRLTKDTELGSNESVKNSSSPPSSQSSGSGARQSCCQTSSSASASASSSPAHFSLDPPTSSSLNPGLNSDGHTGIEILEEQQEDLLEVKMDTHEGYERLKAPFTYNSTQEENESAKSHEKFDSDSDKQGHEQASKKPNYATLKRLAQNRVKPVLNEDDLEESFVRGSGPGGQSINKTSNNVQLLHKPTGIRVTCQETRSLQQNRTIARKKLLEKLDQMVNPGLSKEEMKRAKQVERERRRRKKQRKKAQAKAGQEEKMESA